MADDKVRTAAIDFLVLSFQKSRAPIDSRLFGDLKPALLSMLMQKLADNGIATLGGGAPKPRLFGEDLPPLQQPSSKGRLGATLPALSAGPSTPSRSPSKSRPKGGSTKRSALHERSQNGDRGAGVPVSDWFDADDDSAFDQPANSMANNNGGGKGRANSGLSAVRSGLFTQEEEELLAQLG